MSELTIRLESVDHETQVKVEVDGVPIGHLSHLKLEVDNLNPAPQLNVEFLRGIVFREDLSEDIKAALDKSVEALKRHGAQVKAPK